MISRVADHCFWFGRYLERAESTARMLRRHAQPRARRRAPAARSAGARSSSCPARRRASSRALRRRRPPATARPSQRYMTWDEENAVAASALGRGRARERALDPRGASASRRGRRSTSCTCGSRSDAAQRAVRRSTATASTGTCAASTQLTLGLLRATMLHDDAARLHLARRAARARRPDRAHARRPPPRVHAPLQPSSRQPRSSRPRCGSSLLRACSGFEPFMKRNQGRVTGSAVAAFLMLRAAASRARSATACTRPTSASPGIRPAGDRAPRTCPAASALERLRVLDGGSRRPTRQRSTIASCTSC